MTHHLSEQPIVVSVTIEASLPRVWHAWTDPTCITQWNHASPDWECPRATNDLRSGGTFVWTMAAKDGSAQFDFAGTYTAVVEHSLIESELRETDGSVRRIHITFEPTPDGQTRVVESFDPEQMHDRALQEQGWQAILDSFKRFVEKDHQTAA